ncbi:4-hydroxy-2-oxoheptanedioate aldolase [Candidatus Thalassolituus haligoni]|uniref:4-hydroxy-2-oxoheptanedioate aldolase n=1 Tax=Candidatus Thalassolituus haligoni TaxID=3100113 RepID=UPI00351677E2|tara:strand:+ start:8119 stop:8940 length:822 start_codon:yes stop_codon:yes gene_type:complete
MPAPINHFKNAIRTGAVPTNRAQIGLWLGLANSYTAELLAGAGFDWLLIDGEHSPNDLRTILEQLQAIAPYPTAPIVRPVWPDSVRIKQILDLGVQTILAPMVDTAEQAAGVVAATRYPPEGIRGVGSPLARASQFNRTADYLETANEQICVLIQIETALGVTNLDSILTVEGVDGVFIGPADLSASMGHLNNPAHPEVQAVIEDCIARIVKAGKAPGILIGDETLAKRYIDLGAMFVGVGTDTGLLLKSSAELVGRFNPEKAPATSDEPSVY